MSCTRPSARLRPDSPAQIQLGHGGDGQVQADEVALGAVVVGAVETFPQSCTDNRKGQKHVLLHLLTVLRNLLCDVSNGHVTYERMKLTTCMLCRAGSSLGFLRANRLLRCGEFDQTAFRDAIGGDARATDVSRDDETKSSLSVFAGMWGWGSGGAGRGCITCGSASRSRSSGRRLPAVGR